MSFRLANVQGRASLVADEVYYDLEDASHGRFGPDCMKAIEDFEALGAMDLGQSKRIGALDPSMLGPPVPAPRQVFGIGVNYRSHAAEFDVQGPEAPMVFTKFPSSISGPASQIVLRGDQVDWEVELVVVIGKVTKDISRERAWAHICGLTIGQDISDREVQFAGGALAQFSMGKSFDTYAPIGPLLVSSDALANRDSLAISCAVSGEPMQASRTDHMIFSAPRLVEYLSSIVTLLPGDLIFTGTPEGVGMARKRFLRDGDVIVSAIEGIGVMTNPCVAKR